MKNVGLGKFIILDSLLLKTSHLLLKTQEYNF